MIIFLIFIVIFDLIIAYIDKKCGVKGKKSTVLHIIPIILGFMLAFKNDRD